MSVLMNFLRTDRRCRRKFLSNMVWKGLTGFQKFHGRKKAGHLFPAFHFISITDDCNLKCQGCWVTSGNQHEYMQPEKIESIIRESKKKGSYFFGILGGEPLLHKGLTGIFRNQPDCYFQLFTNGTLLTEPMAEELRRLGNVSPLISLEGDEEVADVRRGGHNIFKRTMQAIRTSTKTGLITGVAISVCKSNIEMALSAEFVKKLHDLGVLYIWYYIYRPTGSNPNYDLALDAGEILRLRRFLVEGRPKYPMILIDSYWRADGEPFCPAADGLSHHINPSGFIEPCPVLQIAKENISEGSLENVYGNSFFLRDFRNRINSKTQGCILMEEPSWIKDFAEKHGAMNSSGRPHFFNDLEKAPSVSSHGSCPVIPEKSLLYRIAKRRAFFGMGAYG